MRFDSPVISGSLELAAGIQALFRNGSIRLYDTGSGNYISLNSPDHVISNYVLTLPTSSGQPDQVLKTDGTSSLYWDVGGGVVNNYWSSSIYTPAGGLWGVADVHALSFTGSVGIGVAATERKLHIHGDTTRSAEIAFTDTEGLSFSQNWTMGVSSGSVFSIKGLIDWDAFPFPQQSTYFQIQRDTTGWTADSGYINVPLFALGTNAPEYRLDIPFYDTTGPTARFGGMYTNPINASNNILAFNAFWNGTHIETAQNGWVAGYQYNQGAHRWFSSTSSWTAGQTGNVGVGLEVRELMRLDAPSGYVGIGTDVPTAKLHVQSSESDLVLVSGSTDVVFMINQSGSVGIGTNSPSASLHIDDYYQNAGDRQFQLKHFNLQDFNSRNVLINVNSYYDDVAGQRTPITTGGFTGIQLFHSGIRFSGGTGSAGVSAPRTTFMHIDNSDANRGSVGIGTTAPNTIVGWTAPDATHTPILNIKGNRPRISIESTSSYGAKLDMVDGAGTINDKWMQYLVAGGKAKFRSITDDGTALVADNILSMNLSDGNIGIGTTSPSEKLHVVGNALFSSIGSGTSAGALHYESDGTLTTNTSDRRLKRNINYISGSEYLDRVLGLEPVTFKWKISGKEERDDQEITLKEQQISGSFVSGSDLSDMREEVRGLRRINNKRKANRERLQYGFIAQDVRNTIPELVGKQDDGMLFLRSEQMDSLLVLALKEQQNMIQDLKARIEILESI